MKQRKLWLLSGPPASGKSTWVDNQSGVIVSRDAIRFSLLNDGDDYFAHEDEVMREFIKTINYHLSVGDTVYVDATHLNWPSRKKVINAITVPNVEIGVICFNTPLEVCLKRNALRTGRACVPTKVITRMYKSFTDPATDPYQYAEIKYIDYNEVEIMGNIYLTSDLHFCHDKEFCYGPRGFSSVEEMNNTIIANYNNIITDNDIVYILGDCMLKNDTRGIELLSSLRGHKYIALGNHDTPARLEKYLPYVEDVQVGYRFRYKKIEFWLSHYPMMMKNFTDPKPVWNLSGHTHGKDKFENGKYNIYNVALDAHDNKPVSLDQIVIDIRQYMRQEKEEIASHTQELNCNKCVEFPYYCSGGHSCPPGLKYRRDPPDGGYYG